jgi:hypothetical protein
MSGSSRTGLHGGADGVDFLDVCPMDQVVIGYRGTIDQEVLTTVQTLCGSLAAVAPRPYRVEVTAAPALPRHGGASGTAWETTCPSHQVVIGATGRSGLLVDGIRLQCAPLAEVGGMLSAGAITTQSYVGGTGGSAFSVPCAAGQVARGTDGRTDSTYVNAFGLVCGTPALVP